MSAHLRAVPDVNVLVSAIRTPNGICGSLIDAATEERWQPVISRKLLEELEDVLARPRFLNLLGQEAIDRFVNALLSMSEWAEDPAQPNDFTTRDPDDDYLIALARAAGVDVLVSGDRDLTDLPPAEPPIEAPAKFAERLR